jgi:hypothetical protein
MAGKPGECKLSQSHNFYLAVPLQDIDRNGLRTPLENQINR